MTRASQQDLDRMIRRGASPSRTAGRRRTRGQLPGVCAALALLAACQDATQPEMYVNCDTPGMVSAEGKQIPVAPNGFAAVGNKIYSAASCEPFRFLGVSRPSLSFSPEGGRLAMDTAAAADF